jgi:hypothetical protein
VAETASRRAAREYARRAQAVTALETAVSTLAYAHRQMCNGLDPAQARQLGVSDRAARYYVRGRRSDGQPWAG